MSRWKKSLITLASGYRDSQEVGCGYKPAVSCLFVSLFISVFLFFKGTLLHPGLSAAQDDYDWFKEAETSQSILLP